MKVAIDAEIRHGGRSGVEARVPELRLTGHGADEQEALDSLHRGIVAWCEGLYSVGKLESAVKHRHLKWEPDGEEISIEFAGIHRT